MVLGLLGVLFILVTPRQADQFQPVIRSWLSVISIGEIKNTSRFVQKIPELDAAVQIEEFVLRIGNPVGDLLGCSASQHRMKPVDLLETSSIDVRAMLIKQIRLAGLGRKLALWQRTNVGSDIDGDLSGRLAGVLNGEPPLNELLTVVNDPRAEGV